MSRWLHVASYHALLLYSMKLRHPNRHHNHTCLRSMQMYVCCFAMPADEQMSTQWHLPPPLLHTPEHLTPRAARTRAHDLQQHGGAGQVLQMYVCCFETSEYAASADASSGMRSTDMHFTPMSHSVSASTRSSLSVALRARITCQGADC
jgi:hypothetical protein